MSKRTALGVATDYGVARFILAVLDFLASLMLCIGAIWNVVSILAFLGNIDNQYAIVASLISLAPALGLFIGGLLIISHGQLIHASLDNADYNREVFEIMRRREERT